MQTIGEGIPGYTADDVEKMHGAWRNSMQLQIALFAP
jgi:hypothetical protein